MHPSTAVAAVAAGLFSAILIATFAYVSHGPFDWCSTNDPNCVREWIAALSGWMAFVGAAVAVPYLAAQVREARRQTEFIIGEALPTVTLEDNSGSSVDTAFAVALKVVNWNRHAMYIHDVRIIDTDAEILKVRPTKEGRHQDTFNAALLELDIEDKRVYLPGWENRSALPPSLSLAVTIGNVRRPGVTSVDQPDTFLLRRSVSIEVDVRLMDAKHSFHTLVATMPDAMTL
ncbi:hypothetical protein [Aminobacter aminovorans]|uniref:hypothetical protein n=1 Tax=Aminobacter aminovorans TaxID=83263 RepID=UPI00285BDC76|nr:hypothetical protein [Aminobacter aminovorans]MDR7220336.1 hypothetical protein [Aminobacter aminovorans]